MSIADHGCLSMPAGPAKEKHWAGASNSGVDQHFLKRPTLLVRRAPVRLWSSISASFARTPRERASPSSFSNFRKRMGISRLLTHPLELDPHLPFSFARRILKLTPGPFAPIAVVGLRGELTNVRSFYLILLTIVRLSRGLQLKFSYFIWSPLQYGGQRGVRVELL
jgi:hypothetical protein